jgi:predicted RecA/RadA family phage recombinase
MKTFVQPGDTLTLPAAPHAVASGAGCKVGSIFGVAQGAADSGAAVDLAVVGVYDLAKVSTDAFAVGAAVFWDDMAKLATSDDDGGDNIKIGVAVRAAGNPSATVRVRLNGAF